LAIHATAGVAQIAEGVHRAVADTLGLPGGPAPQRTGGITGLVYRSVHQTTRFVGGTIDLALAGLDVLTEEPGLSHPPERLAVVAALNGVLGDHLAAEGNPLALPMTLHYEDRTIDWQQTPILPASSGKVLLLIHGLCMNDQQWRSERAGHAVDHGAALAQAHNYAPVYVRYNSGLHISQNGRMLAVELERLLTQWPAPLEELSVVAHSMGGLVLRSALYYGEQAQMHWPRFLKRIVFLGTPHHGAPLERIGNWVDTLLAATPYTAPFAAPGQVRSAGITDLRYGQLVDEDWRGHDRFRRRPDDRQIVPLPTHVACYTVAATTTATRDPIKDYLLADLALGDGLVPLPSALGEHEEPQRRLAPGRAGQMVLYRTHHLALLHDPRVRRQIVEWLGS
jgi:hypothetical protein